MAIDDDLILKQLNQQVNVLTSNTLSPHPPLLFNCLERIYFLTFSKVAFDF